MFEWYKRSYSHILYYVFNIFRKTKHELLSIIENVQNKLLGRVKSKTLIRKLNYILNKNSCLKIAFKISNTLKGEVDNMNEFHMSD